LRVARSPDSTLNPYAAPRSRLEASSTAPDVWREGDLVRLSREGTLPDRCVLCNQEAGGRRVKRNLYHSPLAWRLGALAAPFLALWLGSVLELAWMALLFWPLAAILFAVHFLVRRSLRVELGVCLRHRRIRLAVHALSVVAMTAVMLSLYTWRPGEHAMLFLSSALGALVVLAVIQGFLGVQAVALGRLTDEHAWLARTGKPFREALPEVPG
jgi:hypothetical protein